jgi:hypothetical protein
MINIKQLFENNFISKIIRNLSNLLMRLHHQRRIILFMLLIVIITGILFKFFTNNYQEGLTTMPPKPTIPPTNVTLNLTDKTKYNKGNTSASGISIPYGQYNAQTQYDLSMTPFITNKPTTLPLIFANGAVLTIKPMPVPSDNTDDVKPIFPTNMSLTVQFDNGAPIYYLKKQNSTSLNDKNVINKGSLDIITVGMGGLIADSNYKQIGSVALDVMNPHLYTINIKDSTNINKINVHFTTSAQ